MATPVTLVQRRRDRPNRQNRPMWQYSQNKKIRLFNQNLKVVQKNDDKSVVDVTNGKVKQTQEPPKISKYLKILGGISFKELHERHLKRKKAKLKNKIPKTKHSVHIRRPIVRV